MSNARLTTLDAWAAARFGEHSPNMDTLRRWAREGKIYPAPQKIGRAYFVSEQAQYIDHRNPNYLEMVRGATQTQ